MLSSVMYWKLAIWKGVTGPLMATLATTPTVILNWTSLSTEGKWVAGIGLVLTWYKAIDLFIDNTMARLSAGKPPVPVNGNGNGSHAEIISAVTIDTPPKQ